MIDKTNNEGVKLYVGGEEVTKETLERAMSDYKQKVSSPEFQRELEELDTFFGTGQPVDTQSNYKYFKLPHPPHTVFKLDQENLTSYKFDAEKKCWIEFPTFLVDIEHGNIQVDEIGFADEYPTMSAVDQNKGIKL